jgi:hypothetical protein
MSMTVTLIFEFNCYVPRGRSPSLREIVRGLLRRQSAYESDRATVWVTEGVWSGDDPRGLSEIPGMSRIVGPVPSEEAQRVVVSLRDLLTKAGVTVREESIADD